MKSINIDQALKKGIDAHKAGKVQEAEQYYRSILNSTPDHAVTNHNMGILAVNIGKSDAALNFFKKAIDLNPDIIQFWLSLIETLLRLKRVEEAGIFITKAKRQIPENVALEKLEKTLKDQNADSGTLPLNSYIASATGLRELGEFDKAINVLKSASENYPNEVLIYTLLSHCYMLTNDFEKAEFYHLKTKSFNIDIAEIHWNECRLLLKKKSTSEALVVAQRANETFPNNYEGLGILASCLNESNKIEESLTCVNKALELEPNFTEALVIRGIISLKQKNNKAALKDLENAHKSKPHLRQIWQIIISLKLQAEQFKETILLLLNMIEINPEYDEGVSLLIELTQKVDIPDLTIKSFEKIAKIKNRDYLAFFNLGTAYQKINDNENAIKNFRKTIQIKPDYVEAHNSLGICLYNKGFLEDAIECYKKAIQIKPRYVDALNNLGVSFFAKRSFDDAIKCYQKAISIDEGSNSAKINLAELLKAFSPKSHNSNILIYLDQAIKSSSHKFSYTTDSIDLCNNLLDAFIELQNTDTNIRIPLSQLYHRNTKDLNCKRHTEIFYRRNIISSFCFECYKVQIEVKTFLDLVKLSSLFYELQLDGNLTRKCLTELRPEIPGFYKGLIYCRGLDEANEVKIKLDSEIEKKIDKEISSIVKRGCSEFPVVFPEYGKIDKGENKHFTPPDTWESIEKDFDMKYSNSRQNLKNASINSFCLHDLLVIQRWIDYAKGLDDPTCEVFHEQKIIYPELFKIGQNRRKIFQKTF